MGNMTRELDTSLIYLTYRQKKNYEELIFNFSIDLSDKDFR